MAGQRLLFALGALLLCAATEPPTPPPALQPYIKYGHFDPGDYAWMKGRFDSATPTEKQTYQAIEDWVHACHEQAVAESRAALREQGFGDAHIDNIITGPLLCQEVGFQPLVPKETTFAVFSDELARARPVVQSYLFAVSTAEQANASSTPELRELLERRTLGEQMIRVVLAWGQGAAADAPPLSLLGKAIAQSMIGRAMVERDHANTEWLKQVVAAHGWPTISQVGKEASGKAWLLVQHADADPVFQLKALRLMEPLVANGEVSQQNFAYLYDRVMLKLAGKQRYGTQATCIDGQRKPQALEDAAKLDALRAQAGLDTEADYLSSMDEAFGHCQTLRS